VGWSVTHFSGVLLPAPDKSMSYSIEIVPVVMELMAAATLQEPTFLMGRISQILTGGKRIRVLPVPEL
jgi:hypothetical protein